MGQDTQPLRKTQRMEGEPSVSPHPIAIYSASGGRGIWSNASPDRVHNLDPCCLPSTETFCGGLGEIQSSWSSSNTQAVQTFASHPTFVVASLFFYSSVSILSCFSIHTMSVPALSLTLAACLCIGRFSILFDAEAVVCHLLISKTAFCLSCHDPA